MCIAASRSRPAGRSLTAEAAKTLIHACASCIWITVVHWSTASLTASTCGHSSMLRRLHISSLQPGSAPDHVHATLVALASCLAMSEVPSCMPGVPFIVWRGTCIADSINLNINSQMLYIFTSIRQDVIVKHPRQFQWQLEASVLCGMVCHHPCDRSLAKSSLISYWQHFYLPVSWPQHTVLVYLSVPYRYSY